MEVKEGLKKLLHEQIPMAKSLGLTILRADSSGVEVLAPLAPNSNHMETAFGGSLASVLILACYGWLFNRLRLEGHETHVVIKESKIEYLLPVREDIKAICLAPSEEDYQQFITSFGRKNRGRIILESYVESNEEKACVFRGEFVALKVLKDSL